MTSGQTPLRGPLCGVVSDVEVVSDLVGCGTRFAVEDTSGAPVEGATVYAIPAADLEELAGQPLTLVNGNYTADALKVDEPLEDLINGNFTPSSGGVSTYFITQNCILSIATKDLFAGNRIDQMRK